MREEGEGRGKARGEGRLGERQWRQVIRRVIPEWGGDIFYIIPINAYPVYIIASLMQKRQVDEDRENLHSHTRCVGYMEEGGGDKEGGAYRKRCFVGWLTSLATTSTCWTLVMMFGVKYLNY